MLNLNRTVPVLECLNDKVNQKWKNKEKQSSSFVMRLSLVLAVQVKSIDEGRVPDGLWVLTGLTLEVRSRRSLSKEKHATNELRRPGLNCCRQSQAGK
jgi:hypothetical protein